MRLQITSFQVCLVPHLVPYACTTSNPLQFLIGYTTQGKKMNLDTGLVNMVTVFSKEKKFLTQIINWSPTLSWGSDKSYHPKGFLIKRTPCNAKLTTIHSTKFWMHAKMP